MGGDTGDVIPADYLSPPLANVNRENDMRRPLAITHMWTHDATHRSDRPNGPPSLSPGQRPGYGVPMMFAPQRGAIPAYLMPLAFIGLRPPAGASLPYTTAELAPLTNHCTARKEDASKIEHPIQKSAAAQILSGQLAINRTASSPALPKKAPGFASSPPRRRQICGRLRRPPSRRPRPRHPRTHRRPARFY